MKIPYTEIPYFETPYFDLIDRSIDTTMRQRDDEELLDYVKRFKQQRDNTEANPNGEYEAESEDEADVEGHAQHQLQGGQQYRPPKLRNEGGYGRETTLPVGCDT